jgi:predicted phosphodiesterase
VQMESGQETAYKIKVMLDNRFNIPQSDEAEYLPYVLPEGCHRLLLLPDLHVPYHSYAGTNVTFDFCQDKKIDLILLNGDFMDFHQLSKFVHDPRKRNFKDELNIGNCMLDAIEMAFPKVKKIYKLGNHDERYEKYLKMKAPELIGVREYKLEVHFNLLARGISIVEDQRIIWAGKLPILHGHEINMKNTTVNPARTLYLKTKNSAICSHLHIPSVHKGKRIDNHVISTWSTGHLCEEHPEYARNNDWILGFAVVDFDNEYFEVSNFQIINNKVWRA